MIEVLIAIVVLGLAVLTILATQAFGMRGLAVDPVRQRASEITEQALGRAELSLAEDFSNDVSQEPQEHDTYSDYTVEVTEEIENPPRDTLKKVTVTTTWESNTGRESFQLWTVFVDESAIAP